MQMDYAGWTSHRKAEFAMAKIQERAVTLGACVFLPTREGLPFDCVIMWNGGLHKVQAKFSGAIKSQSAVWIRAESNGRKYTTADVDVIVAFLPQQDEVIWMPLATFGGKAAVSLSVSASRNGQIKLRRSMGQFIWR